MNIVEFDTDIEHEDSNTLCMKCLQGNDSGRDIDTKLWINYENNQQGALYRLIYYSKSA